MEWSFIARKLAAGLLLPPIAPLLLMLLAGIVATRLARLGRILFFFAAFSIVLLSLPAVADWMQYPFEDAIGPFVGTLGVNPKAGAIVVLGGGRNRGAREYGGENLEWPSLERVRFAARLSRSTGLPILVTGGKIDGGRFAEADLMAKVLRDEFTVPVRWVESDAIDTVDNAKRSAALLKNAGITRVLLVTDVMHMHRALYDFDVAGISAIPAAIDYRAYSPHSALDFIPSASAYARSSYVLHEWLGDIYTRWHNPRYADLTSSATLSPHFSTTEAA